MAYLSITGLSRSYGTIKAVRDFSLDVPRGGIMALLGPDGAGKTTLIRVLCHLLDPETGTVTLDGRNLLADFESFKSHLGYMPQSFSLYADLSVEENLTFYAGIYGVTGDAFRQKRDFLYTFSNLAPFAKRRAGQLSGGMKQKLALSCALVHDPEILILDEPTTGVDPLSRRQFWEILLDLKKQGVTIIVSTPYMDEVARADWACFMFAGQKLAEGTPSALADEFDGLIYFLDAIPTTDLVNRLNKIGGLTARRFGAGMHLYIGEQEKIDRFASPLSDVGVAVADLKEIKPGLEDRFIQLMETHS